MSQGADFDGNSPFEVTLELACLHPPTPFAGGRIPFEPLEGVGQVGDHWVRFITNSDPTHFDPYGQAYGDYFADLWYVVSFIHGPVEADEFLSRDDPMPLERLVLYDPAQGFRVLWPGVSLATLLPEAEHGASAGQSGDLYRYLLATYQQLLPTTTLDNLVDRPVELAITGDRSLVPPSSPYSDYRPVCGYEEGRHESTQKNAKGFLSTLALRDTPAELAWPTLSEEGAAPPHAWQRTSGPQVVRPSTHTPTDTPDKPTSEHDSPASPRRWLLLLVAGAAVFGSGVILGRARRRER